MKKNKKFVWPCREGKELSQAFLNCKTEKEITNFLRDICTIAELQAMTERFQVAQLLKQSLSYRQIAEKTGVSVTTIARVAHWLEYGEGGYSVALSRKRD